MADPVLRVDVDDVEVTGDGAVLYQGRPFTGETFETDPQDQVILEQSYLNGLQHGPEREYSADGSLFSEGQFRRGHEVGVHRYWHPNGQLSREEQFTDDGELVEVRHWSEDGTYRGRR